MTESHWLCRRLPFNRVTAVLLTLALAGPWALGSCGQVSHTAQEHLERGVAFEQQSDLAAASIEYRNALQKDPGNAEGRFRLGMLMLGAGDARAAEEELARARDLGWDLDELRLPLLRAALARGNADRVISETQLLASFSDAQVPEALALRGSAKLALGDIDAADTAFRDSLTRDPKQAEASIGLARIDAFQGNHDSARQNLQELIERQPNLDAAWSLLGDIERHAGNLEQAEVAYSRAMDTSPQPALARLSRALTRIELEDYEAATRDVRALQQEIPGYPAVSLASGLIDFRQQRFAEARTAFEESLAHTPNYAPAILYLGMTHARLGNIQQAETHLKRHLGFSPGSWQAIWELANLYAEQGRLADMGRLLEDAAPYFSAADTRFGMLRTQLAFAAGNEEQGLFLLTGLSEQRPDSAELQELLGAELLRRGERDHALRALRQASATDPAPRSADVALILSELEAGNFGAALAAARDLERKQPDRADPWNFIGAALMGLGRPEEAREALQEGLAIEPGHASIAMNLSALEIRLGNVEEAVEILQAVQERNPGHPASAIRLASIARQQGDLDTTAHWLERVIVHYPQEKEPHLMLARLQMEADETDTAVETLERGLANHAEDPQMLLALAEVLERDGQHAAAGDTLARLAAIQPDSSDVQMRLARNLTAAGDLSASTEALQRALEIDPENRQARNALVRQLSLAGEVDAARALFEPIAGDEDSPDVLAQRAWFAMHEGDFERAAEGYAQALAREQRRHWVLEGHLAQLRAGDITEGVATLWRWVDTHPEDHQVRQLLGAALVSAGREEQAIAVFEQLLARRPQDAAATHHMAWLLRERDPVRALDYAERANELAPEEPPIMNTLAEALLRQQEYSRAHEILQQARALAPDRQTIAFNLARSQAALGERLEARTLLERILARPEDFPERQQAMDLLKDLGGTP